MQIIDVASILGLDYDISDHAFQLLRDCCSATCLRNRTVEALATTALVQAIGEAQDPRTLQEISIAASVPQKEIGKYIKILGEALQLIAIQYLFTCQDSARSFNSTNLLRNWQHTLARL